MKPNPRAIPDEIGPYVMVGPLGRGGTASVFTVRDSRDGQLRALKLLAPRREFGAAEERFRREFLAMKALNHPHIAAVHEYGEWDGHLWYTMDLLDGVTLSAWRKSHPPGTLPLRHTLDLMRQAAEGLGAAHSTGLVHRDVKPANLMLTEDQQRLTLVDFGLAKVAGAGSSLTADGKIVGTPVWLAPERLSSNAISQPTWDVYSLGLVFYEALTGYNPFRTGDLSQTLQRIVRTQVAPPSGYRPDLPVAVDKLLLSAMSRVPAKRPADGEVLASRLRSILHDLPPDAP